MSTFKKSALLTVASLVVALIWTTAASAETIHPANHSFELPATSTYLELNGASPTSWTFSGYSVSARMDNKASTAVGVGMSGVTDDQFFSIYGSITSTLSSALYQNLASTIVPGTEYQLLADYCIEWCSYNASYTAPDTMTMRLSAWSDSVETVIATMDIAASEINALVVGSTATFTTFSLPATLPDSLLVGQQLRVYFGSTSTGHTWDYCLDNVRIESTLIPEPGTLALLATGLIGLLCYAWRRRK